jgi:hypothetical protein
VHCCVVYCAGERLLSSTCQQCVLTLHFTVEPTCPCYFNGELIAAQRELLAFQIVNERSDQKELTRLADLAVCRLVLVFHHQEIHSILNEPPCKPKLCNDRLDSLRGSDIAVITTRRDTITRS